jgi:hypothetical protein
MDGFTLDLDRIRNWGCTGVAVPTLAGQYALPAGNNSDRDRRELLAGVFVALYCAVGSAQAMPRQDDPERNAVHQMVVASAALAASEAESYLTLVSAGLESPAFVHLRSLAETVRRLVICRRDPALALRLYGTAEAEWLRLVAPMKIPNVPPPAKGQENMREVERSAEFGKAKADVQAAYHVLSDTEWKMWSKRTHGDIYALVDVSQKLAARGDDVRAAINGEKPDGKSANAHIMRAIGLCLLAFGSIVQEFGIQAGSVYEGFEARYGAMQRRDEDSAALMVAVRTP